jgi:GNAT superfamily N-acetyltransferase
VPKIPNGYEVGRPHRDELSKLAAIEIAAAVIFPLDDLAPELRAEVDPASFFDEAFSAGRLWIARSLNPPAPVGFAVVVVHNDSAHLQEMDVHPDHARQGLGRVLVFQVVSWAQTAGFSSLTLTTFRHLPWNAPFYANLGFLEVPDHDLSPQLRAALANDAAGGLDPSKRVAMRLELSAT